MVDFRFDTQFTFHLCEEHLHEYAIWRQLMQHRTNELMSYGLRATWQMCGVLILPWERYSAGESAEKKKQ